MKNMHERFVYCRTSKVEITNDSNNEMKIEN